MFKRSRYNVSCASFSSYWSGVMDSSRRYCSNDMCMASRRAWFVWRMLSTACNHGLVHFALEPLDQSVATCPVLHVAVLEFQVPLVIVHDGLPHILDGGKALEVALDPFVVEIVDGIHGPSGTQYETEELRVNVFAAYARLLRKGYPHVVVVAQREVLGRKLQHGAVIRHVSPLDLPKHPARPPASRLFGICAAMGRKWNSQAFFPFLPWFAFISWYRTPPSEDGAFGTIRTANHTWSHKPSSMHAIE